MSISVFTYTDRQVRSVLIDGEPWFVLTDVCTVLDLSNPSMVAQRIDPDALSTAEVIDSMRRTQSARIVNEAGLYEVIFLSRKPDARVFKRWVTAEVLPAIRRTGQYGTAVPQSLPEALRAYAEAIEAKEQVAAELEAAAPKISAFDDFMDSDGTYTMEAAAKSLADVTGGIGRNTLMRWLREHKVLMSGNTPYQPYAHWFKVVAKTYTDPSGREHATRTTYVRPAGLDGIRRMWRRSA